MLMTTIGYAVIDIIPSARGFAKKLADAIDAPIEKAGKDSGINWSKGFKTTALAGIGAVFTGLGIIAKTGFSKALEASAGQAQLAAGIKSTGNAAGVTVKGLEALAKSIQDYSGQTKDSIVQSEQLLLTFTNIRNNGPNKILDLATQATADYAAKTGGDAAGAAVLFGKALNNPIRGLALLNRVGVQFTASQEASVKAMMKHGDVAGAQSVILDVLRTKFGGAAKAAGDSLPGQLAKAKNAFADVSQEVVEKLLPTVLPAILNIANAITTKVVPAIGRFIDGFKDGTGAGGELKTVLVSIYQDGLKPILGIINKYQTSFGGLALKLAAGFAGFEALKGVGKLTAGFVKFTAEVKDGTLALKAMYAWEALVDSLSPFGWIAIAVAGLAALYAWMGKTAKSPLWDKIEMAGGGRGSTNNGAKISTYAADAAAKAKQDLENALIASDKGTHGHSGFYEKTKPADKYKPPRPDPAALIAALNLRIAAENEKRTLSEFASYFTKDFLAALADGTTKASDLINQLSSKVGDAASGFAATISDPLKQATFNLGATKITNALNTKLLGFESAFDAIQTARDGLKTKIDDAQKALDDAIKLRSDAASGIADLLSKPFGEPSELVKALSGADATADSIIGGYNNIVKLVKDRFASITGTRKDALLEFVNDQTTKLVGLVKQRTQIAQEFDKAQTALEKIVQTKTDYASGITQGLKAAAASLTEFVQSVTLADGLTVKMIQSPSAMVAAFQARLTMVKNFASNIQALVGRGLGKDLIDQLIGMGADSGGALASSLTTATTDQIAALNDTSKTIGATADALGAGLADKFYGQSVNEAQQYLAGWQSQQTEINSKMSAISQAVADQLSPLTDAMTGLGEDAALGLLQGFQTQDAALLQHARFIGAQMAQAVADALTALNVLSGGPNFATAVTAAKDVSAKLASHDVGVAVGDASGVPAAAQRALADEMRALVDEMKNAPKPATGADIAQLGNQISDTFYGSNAAQARKIQQMSRQGG